MSKPQYVRYLSLEDVVKCNVMDMREAIRDVEDMFHLMATGNCIYRYKNVVWLPGLEPDLADRRFTAQLAYLAGRFNAAGMKWVGSVPENPSHRGLPRSTALIVVSDPETGFPLAIMEGSLLSAIRTGASTGVAARYLANPNAKIAGLVGAGVQNRTQLLALQVVLPELQEVLVHDRDPARTERFVQEMREMTRLKLHPWDDVESLVKKVDVVVSATTSSKPIIKGKWLHPGIFYSHVGDYECDYETISRADKVVVDHLEGIKHWEKQTLAHMLWDGMITDADIHAEIKDIVAGNIPGRTEESEITYYCTIGLGAQDVAVATRIYNVAEKEGIGTLLKLWETPFAV